MDVPKKLKNEIWEFCRENDITDVEDFMVRMLERGFAIEKYGEQPAKPEQEEEVNEEEDVENEENLEKDKKIDELTKQVEDLKNKLENIETKTEEESQKEEEPEEEDDIYGDDEGITPKGTFGSNLADDINKHGRRNR